MAHKSQRDPLPSSKALHLVGRLYRWVAWLGIAVTVFSAGLAFFEQWRNASYYSTLETLRNSLMVSGIVVATGLFLCGMAFLVSLLIEAGLKMLENSHTQVDLMRRLVRQQSDVTSTTRLGNNTASMQAHMQHEVEERQNRQRGR